MKRSFLIACICTLSLQVKGQIILGSTGSLPEAGIWYQVYAGNTSLDPGPAGANQIWDFSLFETADSAANAIVPCGYTTWCYAFPGSAIASIDGGGAYSYYEAHNSHVAVRGFYDSGKALSTVFSDPRVERRFPFTYNSSFVDAWANSHTVSGTLYKQVGVDSVIADAWGKLILPNGTFAQTLRIRTVSRFDDSVVNGGTAALLGSSRQEYYSWYVHGQPRLFVTGTGSYTLATGGAATTFGFSRYTNEIPPPSLSVPNKEMSSLTVFPNPAQDLLQLSFQATGSVDVRLTLSDMTGRKVAELPAARYAAGTHRLELSTAQLAGGVYFLSLAAGPETISRKVNINR